jgi:hypothetical protein
LDILVGIQNATNAGAAPLNHGGGELQLLLVKIGWEQCNVRNTHNIYTGMFVVLGALKTERAVQIYGVENLCGSTGIRGEEKTKSNCFELCRLTTI